MFKRFFIPVILLLVVVATGLVYFLHPSELTQSKLEKKLEIFRTTLANGMEVVVVPFDRVPAVTHMLVVKVGGADDPGQLPGLAHFLEHLMFTGTKQYPEGMYDELLTKLGAKHNAFTTYDYTAYYATLAKEHLETVMRMESDRLQNLQFDDAKAEREKHVILQERSSRVDNSPMAQLAEHMRAVQFLAHPYGRPLIGWEDAIKRFDADAARAFYTRHYRASNMALVVVGDVKPEQVYKLAANYYGVLPTVPDSPRIWPEEPPLKTKRQVVLEDARVRQSRLVFYYDVPSSKAAKGQVEPAYFARVLLAEYLGAARTGMLYQYLVREQAIATDVSVYFDGLVRGAPSFAVHLTVAENVSMHRAERAVQQAVTNILNSPIDTALLEQAKQVTAAQAVHARDGLHQLATSLVGFVALGLDEELFYEWQDNVHAVSATLVKQQAQELLAAQPVVKGMLLPEKQREAAPSVPVAALQTWAGER